MEAYASAEEDEVITKLEEKLQPCEGVDVKRLQTVLRNLWLQVSCRTT